MATKRLVGIKKKKEPPKSLDTVSNSMGERIKGVDDKVKRLDGQLKDIKVKMAKSSGPEKARLKKRALVLLQQKKQYENQADNLGQQQFNIDQQAFALEGIKATIDTVNTMKDTTKQMSKGLKKIKLPKVEKLQDKIEDLMLKNEGVQDVLSRGYDNVSEVDSEELDDMLETLDEFEVEEGEKDKEPDYLKDSAMPSLFPETPTGEIKNTEAKVPAKPTAVGTTTDI